MRWTAVLVGLMLVASGCITGGSDTNDTAPTEPQSVNETSSINRTTDNSTENATYLKNSDYEEVHVHDYWPGNSTERILMDETVQTNTLFSAFYTAFSPFFQDPKTGVGVVWFSLPNGSFVPVGTGKLVVEVDATGALKNGQMALRYSAADSAEFTRMDPQGAQATWNMEVQPTMTDPPHAKSTRWEFILEADGPGAVLDGEINVKITAVKTRELKTWPAHPDFWNQGELTQKHLANINGTYDKLGTFATRLAEGEEDQSAIRMPEGTLVPPETKVLLVKLWYTRDQQPKNNANADVNLRVKEGSSSSYYAWQGDNRVKDEEGHTMYAIPVDGTNWDSPYAEQSNWAFRLYAPTGTHDPAQLYFGIAEAGSGNYTIDVTAYRVIPPWLQSMMSGETDEDDRAFARG